MPRAKNKSNSLPPRTDSGNAELFAELYKNKLLYDHRQKRWLIWKKDRWAEDRRGEVLQFGKRAARFRLCTAQKMDEDKRRTYELKWSIHSEDKYRLKAMVELAQSEPKISDSGEDWDGDAWLLGVANGVLDLRTGRLRKARQSDRITRYARVPFDRSAMCPRFEQFLEEIFSADRGLIEFMRRAIGYGLTGNTREQCLVLCHGVGANGKSTLFRILHHILGDYGHNLPFSAFELKRHSTIPNDLAGLVGRRFVTASETREGVRLNEQRIKALTGEDPITARPLYKEFFTFEPTHKIWLAFNHKPTVADDSEGMWRRIRLIPFTRVFAEGERDKGLFDNLRAEAAGILAWAVQGCLEWQREGLGMPSAVASETNAYRAESDHMSQFIEECCFLDDQASTPASALWDGYKRWVEDNDEVPLSRKAFTGRLEDRKLRRIKRGHQNVRTWHGIGLAAGPQQPGVRRIDPNNPADIKGLGGVAWHSPDADAFANRG